MGPTHFIAIMGALILAFAQPSVSSRRYSDDPADSPLVWESMVVDLGDISDVEPIEFGWKFRNDSDEDVVIEAVRVNSAPPLWIDLNGQTWERRDSVRVRPGDAGRIVSIYNGANRIGSQQRPVLVLYESDPDHITHLTMTCRVLPRVFIIPNKTRLARVEFGQGQRTTISIFGQLPNFAVTEIATGSDLLVAKIGEPKAVERDGDKLVQIDVDFELLPGHAIGKHFYSVDIETNDPLRPSTRHSLSAIVVGDVAADPNTISLGRLVPNAPFSAGVTIRDRLGRNYHITDVRFQSLGADSFSVVAAIDHMNAVGDECTVWIYGVTAARYGPLRAEMQVSTSLGEKITVPINGFVNRPLPNPRTP